MAETSTRRRTKKDFFSLTGAEGASQRLSFFSAKGLFSPRRLAALAAASLLVSLYLLKGVIRARVLVPWARTLVPAPEAPVAPRYVLRTSFSDDPATMVHQQYQTGMDACRILQQCFIGSDVYGSPQACKRNLDPTIKYYDSGFYVEVVPGQEDRLVGFLSVHHDVSYRSRSQWQRSQQNQPPQTDDYHAFILYNVCIDEERRGQGLAKAFIPKFLDAMVKHYRLEKYASATGSQLDPATGKPIPPLLVGLDVDLTSDMMPDAFSLYAKLGFVRWWTPCSSVANHKWASLVDTQLAYREEKQGYSPGERKDEQGNVKRAAGLLPTRLSEYPLAKLLWDPQAYLKNAFDQGTSSKKHSHFCMYKFYSDSFHTLAKGIFKAAN